MKGVGVRFFITVAITVIYTSEFRDFLNLLHISKSGFWNVLGRCRPNTTEGYINKIYTHNVPFESATAV